MKNISKFLKPIFILAKANWKQQTKDWKSILSKLFRPVGFLVLYFAQTFIFYDINPDAFPFDRNTFLIGVSVQSAIISSAGFFYTSVKHTAKTIKNSQIDYTLLRPVDFFCFKYFTIFNSGQFYTSIMSIFFLILFSGFEILFLFKSMIFILLSASSLINLWSFVLGSAFVLRNYEQANTIFLEFLLSISNKPINIFPKFYELFLIFVLPFVVMLSFSFEIAQKKDDLFFWSITLFWTGFSMFLNWIIWKKGLEKYESMG